MSFFDYGYNVGLVAEPDEVEINGTPFPKGGPCFVPVRNLIPRANPLRYGRYDRVHAVKTAIERNKRFDPIAVDPFMQILDGHHRHLAALMLGFDSVPVQRVFVPLSLTGALPDRGAWDRWNTTPGDLE